MLGASGQYREFFIKKQNGQSRWIAAPSVELRQIQRRLLDRYFSHFPIDVCAKAYVPGRSIRDAAKFHVGQKALVKFDIQNFFVSIKADLVHQTLLEAGIEGSIAAALATVCTYRGSLPQGAPTSGYLSNMILQKFDRKVFQFCRKRGLKYTRYSDDIVISGNFIRVDVVKEMLVKALSKLGLFLNESKTRFVSYRHRQVVAGLVVNSCVSPGRTFLRKLRQELFYVEKFGLQGHAASKQYESAEECLAILRGKIAYAEQITLKRDMYKDSRAMLKILDVRSS